MAVLSTAQRADVVDQFIAAERTDGTSIPYTRADLTAMVNSGDDYSNVTLEPAMPQAMTHDALLTADQIRHYLAAVSNRKYVSFTYTFAMNSATRIDVSRKLEDYWSNLYLNYGLTKAQSETTTGEVDDYFVLNVNPLQDVFWDGFALLTDAQDWRFASMILQKRFDVF